MKKKLMFLGLSVILTSQVYAQQPSSTNYQTAEVFIGAGGDLDSSSTSFEAKSSIGDLGVGLSASTAFQAIAGFSTTDQPYLEFYVDGTTIDFGQLTDSTTATGTAQFYVRTYLSSGYVVTAEGPSFANENGTAITSLATPTASTAGVEQFGMNVVENASPIAFGADPVQIPDASFSFGLASTGYDTADFYKYVQGDTIAESATSTGQTNYTSSYIANIGPITEAGVYTMEQTYVATSTF